MVCQHQDLCRAFEDSAGSCLVGAHGKGGGGVVICHWQVVIQPAAKPRGLAAQTTLETEAAR